MDASSISVHGFVTDYGFTFYWNEVSATDVSSACGWLTGLVQCEVYYNSYHVSSGASVRLSVLATGARHVTIEPRTLAVPYGRTARLRCIYDADDDDTATAAAETSWTWLVNGHPINSTSQYNYTVLL